MAGGPKVDHLDPVGLPHRVDQHDVLWLEVGVYETQLFEFEQGGENLEERKQTLINSARLNPILLIPGE